MLEFATIICKCMKPTGMASFTIKGDKISVHLHDALIFVSNIAFGIFMCFVSWSTTDLSANKSAVVSYGNLLTVNCAILIAIISMINSFILKQPFWNFLVELDVIHRKVNRTIF